VLRVLQERTVQRIGSNKPIPLDFRLVAASNADLAAEVRAGRFREDLYYRLQVFPIRVPPLRERRADIPLLADHFRRRFAEANGVQPPEITPDTALRMMEHDWPGNVRELENAVERMLVTHLGASTARFESPAGEAEPAVQFAERGRHEGWDLARLEREYILATIEHLGGRRGEAADRLGIDRRTLGRKLRAYRIARAVAAAGGSATPVPTRRRKPRGQRRAAGITAATWAA
jgi:two-component system response regulator HydG